MKRVFSKEKYIKDMGEESYEKYYEWIDECEGLTKEEMNELGYETFKEWMEEAKNEKVG